MTDTLKRQLKKIKKIVNKKNLAKINKQNSVKQNSVKQNSVKQNITDVCKHKWIKCDFNEADDYDSPSTITCRQCKEFKKYLFLKHVDCGDYICYNCKKDVDILYICFSCRKNGKQIY
jgi:UDP-N-acetylmuramyl tripeptide synthase